MRYHHHIIVVVIKIRRSGVGRRRRSDLLQGLRARVYGEKTWHGEMGQECHTPY